MIYLFGIRRPPAQNTYTWYN